MKKIIAVLILGLAGLTSSFACESVFDSVEGMTCEIQYGLCREYNQDIKLCKRMKKKAKAFEKALQKAERKYQLLRVEADRLLKGVKFPASSKEELKALDDYEDAAKKRDDADNELYAIYDNFFEGESKRRMASALFEQELFKLFEKLGIEWNKVVEIQ